MNIITKDIVLQQEQLTLTNQRVLFWMQQKALILSDLHIGKSAHFQKSGIPIPSNVFQQDLNRLESLIRHFQPKQLIIVGDLFHAEHNQEVQLYSEWMRQFAKIRFTLIKGNHDRFPDAIYERFGIEVFPDRYALPPFVFVHEPEVVPNPQFQITGHVHPGVMLKGKGKQYIKLPCFQMNQHQLVLPAFSLFTGLNTRQSLTNAVNYAFTEAGIFTI